MFCIIQIWKIKENSQIPRFTHLRQYQLNNFSWTTNSEATYRSKQNLLSHHLETGEL